MSRELELQLLELDRRLERAESTIALLQNPPDKLWMSPNELEAYTGGKYPAQATKRLLEQAIANPADSPLHLGQHFIFEDTERYRYFRVHLVEFDRAMIEVMRISAST